MIACHVIVFRVLAFCRRAWGVEHLSPQALNNAVAKLRKILGITDLIQTQRLDGYRLAIELVWKPERIEPRSDFSRWIGRSRLFLLGAVLSAAVLGGVTAWLSFRPGGDALSDYLADRPGNWAVEVQEVPRD
jgi:hypothetical protein